MPDLHEQDIDWLLAKHPEATEAQQDDFAERVAIAICDGKMDEDRAREFAAGCVYGD